MKRVYHKVTSLEEATGIIRSITPAPAKELIGVRESIGRMTAEPVVALRSVPHYLSAGYDGYAVDARSTFGATESNPKKLEKARLVSTGDPLSFLETCVVPLEDVVEYQGSRLVYRAFHEGANVRQVGEDVVVGDMIVPARHWIESMDAALMLAAGVTKVEVLRRPRVLIVPTGDEIRDPEGPLGVGEIAETNSVLISSELAKFFEFKITKPVPNNIDLMREAIRANIDVDLVATIAGSSRGERDLIADMLTNSDEGELLVHGVNIKPGKPLIIGRYLGKPFIGFPGFPVSTWVILKFLIPALVETYYGHLPEQWQRLECVAGRKIPSEGGTVEYIRGVVGKAPKGYVFLPLARGAGVMSSVVRANAVVEVEAGSEGFVGGATLTSMAKYAQYPLMAASDDLALKFLLSEMRKRGVFVNYVFTGSASALELFSKGFVVMAGAHLLCADGTYNRCMVPEDAIKVPFVFRQQGFMVPRGNPKGIKSVEDLLRRDLVMVNREKGSGTRILLDHLLREKGLSPEDINGYDTEEYSHLRVAMAVATGMADVGIGIKTAADAMGLDFVPIVEEQYDLFFAPEAEPLAQHVREVIDSQEFLAILASLGGYRPALKGGV
ncbi:PhnD/SsuA/transferrin family substrate-binding protein [Coprothermobacteraceae bacterium]|nr:PhnD/SsuA/transferrin family substrate-binding protein [Coprothermobacteraceae bacterium]